MRLMETLSPFGAGDCSACCCLSEPLPASPRLGVSSLVLDGSLFCNFSCALPLCVYVLMCCCLCVRACGFVAKFRFWEGIVFLFYITSIWGRDV